MRVSGYTGKDDLATVYVADLGEGRLAEFVESVQPPVPREKKWVLIVSTLCGCPVSCSMCDAGSFYGGKLSKEEISAQIDFLVEQRYPDRSVPVEKFKVQFARMGEPSFNPAVLEVLEELPVRYDAPGLMPCLSTVAPVGTKEFFEQLLEIKRELFTRRFQLQFSIHTTDEAVRDRLIPVNKWDLGGIARYGERFFEIGDRKVALNFALAEDVPLDPVKLTRYFDPEVFLIKITPVNPTFAARSSRLVSRIEPSAVRYESPLIGRLRACGYEVIVSIGQARENEIGSNCGQYVMSHLREEAEIDSSYTHAVKDYQAASE